MSDCNGLSPHKHLSGHKSYLQIEQEMVEELDRPITPGEVFIRTHKKKDGTYVDKKAQQVAEAYQKNKAAKLTELEIENSDTSDVYFTNERGRHNGIGSLESTLFNGKQKYSGCSSLFMDLQKQFDEAHRKIEEQAAHNAKQEKKLKDFSLVEKFMSQTDPRFLAFIVANSQPDA